MISPVWAEFPDSTSPEFTSFHLQLSKYYDEEELVQEIMTFDPAVLIFLRRLKVINLQITKSDGTIWSRKVYRTDVIDDGHQVVILLSERRSCGISPQHLESTTFLWTFSVLAPRSPNFVSHFLSLTSTKNPVSAPRVFTPFYQ